jgi:hypothetical protein
VALALYVPDKISRREEPAALIGPFDLLDRVKQFDAEVRHPWFSTTEASTSKGYDKSMTHEEFAADERQLIGRCLYEAANGAYFPDWEFDTLIGADRTTVRKVASNWLMSQSISNEARILTFSVLNNLLGYPHKRALELERATGEQISSIKSVFKRLER